MQFSGKQYISTRRQVTSPDSSEGVIMFTAENFFLNSTVKIHIEGSNGTNVSVKLRVV